MLSAPGETATEQLGHVLADISHSTLVDVVRLIRRRYPPVVYGVADPGYLPVFVFHTVQEDDFGAKLKYLQANGYRTVTLDEAVDWMQRAGSLPARAVVLTIDDGRPSTWSVAAPLLQRYGMQATAYVIPGYLEEGPARATLADVWRGTAQRREVELEEREDSARFLRWSEVEALHRSEVISIQSHSMLHRRVFAGPKLAEFVTPNPAGPVYDVAKDPEDREPWHADSLAWVIGHPIFEHRPLLSLKRGWVGGRRCSGPRANGTRAVSMFANRNGQRQLRHPRDEGSNDESHWVDLANEQLWELTESRRTLESRLAGGPIRHFCYPNSSGLAHTIDLARSAGYVSSAWALLDHRRTNRVGAEPHLLSRIKHDFIFALPGDGRRSMFELLNAKLARRLRGDSGY